LDNKIPEYVWYGSRSLFKVVAALALMIAFAYFTLIIIVPITIGFIVLGVYFRKLIIQLRHLSSLAISPVYSHLTETLNGMSSIRSYGCADRFINRNYQLVDVSMRAMYALPPSLLLLTYSSRHDAPQVHGTHGRHLAGDPLGLVEHSLHHSGRHHLDSHPSRPRHCRCHPLLRHQPLLFPVHGYPFIYKRSSDDFLNFFSQ